jgi:hypothetical protein
MPYGQEYISLLARQGKLMLTKKAETGLPQENVENYISTRKRN